MTTEQCTVDSIVPKNRTETFARQLQNRLRTLNNEIERDGLEDTSWNGDQLSSSSDDIYYDLDSCPGSPVEEATETNYINIKPQDGACSSSEKQFLNQSEYSAKPEEHAISYGHVGQLADSVNHHISNKSAPCVCFNKLEFPFCEHCSRGNYDGASLSGSSDNTTEFSHYNGLPHMNYSYPNGSKDESLINNFNGTNYCSEHQIHNGSETSTNTSNRNGTHCSNGIDMTYNRFQNGVNYDHCVKNQTVNDVQDCYSCSALNNHQTPQDMNKNSAESNNNSIKILNTANPENQIIVVEQNITPAIIIQTINKNVETCAFEDKCHVENIHEEVKANDKSEISDEDLCRLVDAVFSKSQETYFGETSNEDITETKTAAGFNNASEKREDDEEEETIESKRSRFRKCSSLKSGKTPPGTPAHKKIVRFADVLGLDLADVRTFLDEIPKVPKSAFTDLKNVELSSSPPVVNMLDSYMTQIKSTISTNSKTIVPLFQQPSNRLEFIDRIRDNFVCLENAMVTDVALSVITGVVRVKNIDFHKSVHIRYSIDSWKSFADLQAKYTPNSCDGFSDRFTFTLYAHMLNVGQRLEFAIRYHTNGTIYWDNNLGANYTFQCIPNGPSKVLPTRSYTPANPIETWASFY